MLWYKAWLESRLRFLICLVAISASCTYAVNFDNQRAGAGTPGAYYYSVVHGGYGLVAVLWIAGVCFLTMGGLLREKTVGAASFTLALPFSRTRLMGTRIAVGLIEAMALIVAPSITMCIEDSMIGKAYPKSQAWFHIVLLVGGGLVFFAIALLAASLVEGEYTAPLVSFCVVFGTAFVLRDPESPTSTTIWNQAGQTYSPLRFMRGTAWFDRPTGLLLGPIPWMQASIFVLLAALLIGAAVKVIQIRDF